MKKVLSLALVLLMMVSLIGVAEAKSDTIKIGFFAPVSAASAAADGLSALNSAGAKGDRQIIFMNWPAKALAASATKCDAADGIIFTTASNPTGTGDQGADVKVYITDIDNAVEGVVYHIVCGGATNPTEIAKSDKFSTIASAWQPTAVGDYIDVYYDATASKFYEVGRKVTA